MNDERSNSTAALTSAVFHILLALSEGECHGLGIAEEIEDLTLGTLSLGPGTLYRSLKRMTADGLVLPILPTSGEEDPRRKYYRLTARGRRVLEKEAIRFERIVTAARRKRVLPGSAS